MDISSLKRQTRGGSLSGADISETSIHKVKKKRKRRRSSSTSNYHNDDSSTCSAEHSRVKKKKLTYEDEKSHRHKKRKHKNKKSKTYDSDTSSFDKKKKKKDKKRKKKKKLKNKEKLKDSRETNSTGVNPQPKTTELRKADESKPPARIMQPMTKEMWEKQQSTVRRVHDPETGRNRLIRGDGEIIEEIVSKERHKEINKQATKGDGLYYQSRMGLLK